MSNKRTYDFKSVGEKLDGHNVRDGIKKNTIPIGIKTPLELGEGHDGIFKMHNDIISQIHDNFKNLLLTNHGDRLGLYDFGANLSELAFELIQNEALDTEVARRISIATKKYMPFIELEDFTVLGNSNADVHSTSVVIRVSYSVPNVGLLNKLIDVNIYAVG
jgi:phage baseplate assembly protein W